MKKIAVFTSIRSEYGLLSPLLQKIAENKNFNLKLLVGGAHLLDSYGKTVDRILEDGFPIHAEFPFLQEDSQKDMIYRSLGVLQQQIGSFFASNPIDLLLVLGDRFELIPVVLAALISNIPVAHVSGGEVTEGAIDNQVRHAITKMAHIHFTATEQYSENIKKMGEEDWRVVTTGEPGLDLLKRVALIPKEHLFADLGLTLTKPLIICTFHPETISNKITPRMVKELLLAIMSSGKYQILLTAANFDEGGVALNALYEELGSTYENITYIQSLGQVRYYSVLKTAALMLGNSSSGLVEAQSFNLPVVNVGERQAGRLSNKNVLSSGYGIAEVLETIKIADSKDFRAKIANEENIYGNGNASDKIIQYLENVNWENLLLKRNTFY